MTRWTGVIGVENELTGDGRIIETGALEWGDLPIPLRHVREDNGGHDGATVVGRITNIERDGNLIVAEGDFDDNSNEGVEAARQVAEQLLDGVSMDLDNVSFEVRARLEDDEPGEIIDSEGRTTVADIEVDDEIMVTTSARIRAATLVAVPAFASAKIAVTEETVVASAYRVDPPLDWFTNPGLGAATPIEVTDEGRVFGHIATWDSCHIGGQGECIQPPRSAKDYAYFLCGSVRTSEGTDVSVGHITMGTGHADVKLGSTAAAQHYDDTGTVVADVNVGEDAVGIWVSGALRPDVSDSQVRALRASPMSGDWRRLGSALELVAVLAVNTPGFPIPRPAGVVASGDMQTLVAAGVVAREPADDQPDGGSADGRILARLVARERESDRAKVESTRRRLKVDAMAQKLATL